MEREYMAARFTRIAVLADNHSGHRVGLTPPDWWFSGTANTRQVKIAAIQQEMWKWFTREIDKLKPFTHCFHLGDAIDGKGERSGGTEQTSADRGEQAQMAAAVINHVGAPVVVMVHGTPYHVGADEDWESEILPHLKAAKVHLEGHAFPLINGVQFDLKHFISNSDAPHTRFTALAKTRLWNVMWHHVQERQPDAQIVLRAHIHEYRYCGADGWEVVSCPALQGYGSKYGARRCQGTVDIGFLVYEIEGNGTWRRITRLARLPHQVVQPLQL